MTPQAPSYPLPIDEDGRLAALAQYGIAVSEPEEGFDRLVRLTARLFDVPIALISLVGRERQFFAAHTGLGLCETSRDGSFCAHALLHNDLLIVEDATADTRFASNPLVTGPPGIRFYAGAPLVAPSGHKVGTVCIIDTKPRPGLTACERRNLVDIAALTMDRMEMHRLDHARRVNQTRFESIASTSPDGIVCSDAHGRITFWNPACETLFRYSAADAIGRPLDIIIPERLRGAHNNGMRRVIGGGPRRLVGSTVEVLAARADGSELPVELSLSTWGESEDSGFGGIIRDVTERRRSEERLFRLAHVDQLTELPNRRVLQGRIEAAVKDGNPASVLMLDLDGFKDVNDTLGHSAGDRVLKMVANRIAAALRPEDTAARLGGDEFGILLPGVGDPLEAAATSEALMRALAEPFELEGQPINLGASIGLTLAPAQGRTAEHLLANADLALYKAKEEGRQALRLFEPGLRQLAVARRSCEQQLRRALKNGELEMFYQPQVRLRDGALVGVEALMRWRHPDQGVLSPAAFLPVLEKSNMAGAAGDWAIREACAQGASWRRQGLEPIRVGVNLFGAQFKTGRLLSVVREALDKAELPADALELEITENIVLHRDEAVFAQLEELRALGVGLAFDDYGTGYASLSLLKRCPLTRLKIDRSFVGDITADSEDAAIVQAVLYLGQSFGLDVIAEGVETTEQASFLSDRGCPEAQGYLFGKPMPSAELLERFASSPAAKVA